MTADVAWVRRLPFALLAIAAVGFLALGLSEARSDSPTYDEPVYVASGIAAVLHHDLAFNAEHPPLPKALAALPVLAVHPAVPATASCADDNERTCSAQFVQAQSADRLRDITFASRLVPLLEAVGVAFVAYALAAELFGAAAGALAGLLWLASPLVLGIGHLDGTDIPFALAVTLSSWALARWLRLRTVRALAWTGLALALTAGTSISGALVVIVSLAVILGASWRSGVRRAFVHTGLAAVVTWIGLWIPYVILDPAVLTHPTVIAPKPYLDGVSYLASYNASGIHGYLLGVAYTGGRWWFWPLSLLIKYPAPILLAAGRRRDRVVVDGPGYPPADAAGGRPAGRRAGRIHHHRTAQHRRPVAPAGAGPVGGRGQLARTGRPTSRDRLATCAGRYRGRAARGRRRQHGVVVPDLGGVDGAAVHARIRGSHRLQCRLGTRLLRTAVLEQRPQSVGHVLRAARPDRVGHTGSPSAARRCTERRLRLGRGIRDGAHQCRQRAAGLVA